jgi:hypothetical protein
MKPHDSAEQGRPIPPAAKFQAFRDMLYPENPLEALFLKIESEEERFEAARQLAIRGEIRQARAILEAGREELQGLPRYRWALFYLQQKLGDWPAALASLYEILATPALGSRETLRAWKLLRDLGESPPPAESKRVLGVVVEGGFGGSVLVVAAYADGQPRFFASTGAGAIGDRWTDAETAKAHEIVRQAQELLEGMAPTEDRQLPKPGRVRFIFQTPGGCYGAEDSLVSLNQWQGPYAQIFSATDQLFGMLFRRYEELEKAKT